MIKSIILLTVILLYVTKTQAYPGEDSCTIDKLNSLGSELLREDQDTINLWRDKYKKDDILCAALKGYQHRKNIRRKMLIGTLSISGAGMLVLLAGAFSSDGGYGSMVPENIMIGSGIVAAVNAAIWMGFYTIFRLQRTEPEKELIQDYKNFKDNTQSNLKLKSNSILKIVLEF